MRVLTMLLCAFALLPITINCRSAPPLPSSPAKQEPPPKNSQPPADTVKPEPVKEEKEFVGTLGITEKSYATSGVAVLTNVRAASYAGYDRFVFEFQGSELPSYHVEYIDKPV